MNSQRTLCTMPPIVNYGVSFEHFGEKILFDCCFNTHCGLNYCGICDLSFHMHFCIEEQLRQLFQHKYRRSMLHFFLNRKLRYHTVVNQILIITDKQCHIFWMWMCISIIYFVMVLTLFFKVLYNLPQYNYSVLVKDVIYMLHWFFPEMTKLVMSQKLTVWLNTLYSQVLL